MLQAIREKAQGWIAWAIVILISIPFALWGIQEYLGVGGEPEVAAIDGETITERMLDQRTLNFRESLRLSLGDSYRSDLFDESTLKREVLDAMIEERVLATNAEDWNLRASDLQVRTFISSIPAFQRDGRFDPQMYEAALRNRGMSVAGFEQSVRQDLALSQLRSGVRDSAFLTDADLATRVRLVNEQRTFSYLRVPAAAQKDEVTFDEDDLRRFYEANVDRYRTPERVKLSYLLLDVGGLTESIDVSEDRLEQFFESYRSQFVAREERALRHILIALPPDADADAIEQAEARAADLRAQIRGGAAFADLAREHSDDPGSAANGGDLGWVERGLMVPDFEAAAFALEEGEVSEPVRTEYGIHLIEVTGVRGGSDAGFSDVRDKVEAAYRKAEAENLYFDYAERLAETAYENAASLAPAAEALEIEVRTTDWLTRDSQLAPPLDSPKILNAAFSYDVLVEGNNSELIEVGPQRAVVVRVAEHEPAGVLPFESNLARIEADYIAHEAAAAAAALGEQVLAALGAGEQTLEGVASDRGWELQRPGTVDRNQAGLPSAVLDAAFSLPPPSQKATYAGVRAADGDYLLIELTGVQGGTLQALEDEQRTRLTEQAVGQAASAQMNYLTESLRERAEVEVWLATGSDER